MVHACNPSYLRSWGGRIIWTQEVEIVVNKDHIIRQQSETLSQNKTKKEKEKKTLSVALEFWHRGKNQEKIKQ